MKLQDSELGTVPPFNGKYLLSLDPDALVDTLESHVRRCVSQVELAMNVRMPGYEFDCGLRGRAAGQLRYNKRGRQLDPCLRFNRKLLEQNRLAFFEEVAPHEVSHLAAYCAYGRKIKPHGREWRSIMFQAFGLEGRVTHDFEIEPRQRKLFAYHCACPDRTHEIGIIRHNRILSGKNRYLCVECKTELLTAVY